MARAHERFAGHAEACAAPLEAVMESLDDGVILCDGAGRILRMNRKAMELHGYACVEEARPSLPESSEACELYTPEGSPIPPADWPLSRARRGEAFTGVQVRFCAKGTGAERTVRCCSTPYKDRHDNTELTVLILQELDRRSEATQRESESRLESIFRAAPVGIGLVSNRILLDANDRLCAMVGYGREELIGQNSRMLYPTRAEWEYVGQEKYRQIRLRGTGAVETRWQRKDGEVIEVLLSSTPLDPGDLSKGVTFTALDITDRRRAEDELRSVFNLSLDMICIADIRTDTFVKVNPAFERTLGYSERELLSLPFMEFVHPDDVDRTVEALQEKLRRGEHVLNFENRYRCKNGSYRWLNWTSHPRPEQGLTYAVARDITERKQAEEALGEKEYLLSESQRIGHIGSWSMDLATGIVTWTRETYRLYGVSPESFVPSVRTLISLLHPDDRQAMQDWIQAALAGQHPGTLEFRAVLPDDSLRILSGRGELIHNGASEPRRLVGTVQDVTEHKQAEETLRRLNEHLESLVAERTEDLTRTVARLQQMTWELSQAEDRERRRIADLLHDDVQQILAGARFHLHLLSLETQNPEDCREVICEVRQMLKNAIEKARNLSHELSPALYQVDLAAILNWLGEHMRREHGLTVHVKTRGRVDPSSEPLKALLYRVAQELLFNVVKHADRREADIYVRRVGRCICLSVTDHGRGFDPRELEGTVGFGLLSVHERIRLLGGRIRIRSAPGMGSKIQIVVPDPEPLQGLENQHQIERQ